jgi:P27 family predicted phage terminase small subunit
MPRDGWEVPGHLTGEAEAAWRHVVALLARAGNLSRTDPTLVECYAVQVALLRDAAAAVGRDGLSVRRGLVNPVPVPHPAVAIINTASMRLKTIIRALGLCPASSQYSASSGGPATAGGKWTGLLHDDD